MALTKVPSNLDSVTATTQSASDNSTNVATTEYVTTAVANLVDGAPSTLNTLNEIAAALNDDAALNTTLTNSIATKLPLAGGTLTGAVTGTSFTAPSGFLGGSNGGIRIHVGGTKFFNITAANAARDNHMDIGASDARFKDLHLGGIANIGSGFKLDPNSSGRIGMNRDPANGNATASSSLQRIQINGPIAGSDFLDIQNYNSSGTYKGSLRLSDGNVYITGSNDMRIKLSDSGIAGISDSNNTVHIRGDNDYLKLNAAGNGGFIFEENGTERMRIDPEGNISVGTQKVDPNWSQFFNAISGNYGGHISFQNNSVPVTSLGNNFYLNNSTLNQRVLAYPAQQLKLDHQGNFLFESAASGTAGATFSFTEKMRLTNSGSFLVGTTSAASSYSVATFAGNQKGIAIYHNGTSPNYRAIYSNSSGNLYFYNGSNEGYLSSAGAWTNASDREIKKDIVDIDYGLSTVKLLQPRRYKMKADDTNQIGFIAQEMEIIIPELAGGEEGKKGVNYGQLTAVLTKAIQEQQTIIEDLKSRIETLEG